MPQKVLMKSFNYWSLVWNHSNDAHFYCKVAMDIAHVQLYHDSSYWCAISSATIHSLTFSPSIRHLIPISHHTITHLPFSPPSSLPLTFWLWDSPQSQCRWSCGKQRGNRYGMPERLSWWQGLGPNAPPISPGSPPALYALSERPSGGAIGEVPLSGYYGLVWGRLSRPHLLPSPPRAPAIIRKDEEVKKSLGIRKAKNGKANH